MPKAANAPLLRAAVFVREIGQVSKRANISRIFTAPMCQLPGQANWLRAALYLGLGLTEVSWCHSKIQGPDLPCGFLWGGPSAWFVSDPNPPAFFHPEHSCRGVCDRRAAAVPTGAVLSASTAVWGCPHLRWTGLGAGDTFFPFTARRSPF